MSQLRPIFVHPIRLWCSRLNRSDLTMKPDYKELRRSLVSLKISVLYALCLLSTTPESILSVHEHLCLPDDYTNELPIFIEKRQICNFDTVPVPVYSIKITPDPDYDTKLCLKGELFKI